MTLSLQLFGSPVVEFGGASSALPFERRGQLVAFLALKGAWVPRPELASLLWPDLDGKLALANLRKALFRMQSMSWADRVEVRADALRVDAATDVAAFEQALGERRLADALRLRRGELLAGFDDGANEAWTSWLHFERNRLRVAWRAAAQELLAADIEPAAGADLAARLLDEDPFDEEALRAYMSCLARSGQAARARQAYRDFVERLERELGLAPSAALAALHASLASPRAAAAPRDAPAPADDGFVGRIVELRRIASLLAQDDCRLLSIFGPGGVGKTRLARRVGRELAASFADGVAFVALDDLDSAAGLADRLAREFDVAPQARGDPQQRVIEALRPRQLLLVLDNFEQLVDGAPLIERLLADCPRLKVVVTSRVRLALGAEWLMPLEGLPCPEDDDLDRIESFDAARLFLRAARKVQPEIVPSAEAAAIVEICRFVDGLPLALELAAAWARVLPCAQIARELQRGTELLRAADAARPSRHASFEVVFEQSWRLLGAAERDALARLSVFPGSFTAEAARSVAAAPLPVLGALADKSLLRMEAARLRLHPLVQQLAAARLGGGEASAATHALHAAYFHRLLAQLRAAVESGDRSALKRLDEEFENCRRAWTWSVARGERELLLGSVEALLAYCDHRGRSAQGLELLQQALDSPAVQADRRLHAHLLGAAAQLHFRLDRYAEAAETASRALAAIGRSRDLVVRMRSLNVLGTCALRLGRLDEARRCFRLVLDFAPASADSHDLVDVYDHLALVEKQGGHYAEARRLSLKVLPQYRSLGDSAGEALCLNNLGALEIAMNDNAAAGAHLREALAICERDGLVAVLSFVLANLTEVALRAGELDAARALGERAVDVTAAAGHRAVAAWSKLKLVRVAVRQGDAKGARAALPEAVRLVVSLGLPSLKFESIESLADLLAAEGAPDCARALLRWAAAHPAATAPARDQLRAALAHLGPTAGEATPRPTIDLDDLLHRIAADGALAFAPLIATLRGAP